MRLQIEETSCKVGAQRGGKFQTPLQLLPWKARVLHGSTNSHPLPKTHWQNDIILATSRKHHNAKKSRLKKKIMTHMRIWCHDVQHSHSPLTPPVGQKGILLFQMANSTQRATKGKTKRIKAQQQHSKMCTKLDAQIKTHKLLNTQIITRISTNAWL